MKTKKDILKSLETLRNTLNYKGEENEALVFTIKALNTLSSKDFKNLYGDVPVKVIPFTLDERRAECVDRVLTVLRTYHANSLTGQHIFDAGYLGYLIADFDAEFDYDTARSNDMGDPFNVEFKWADKITANQYVLAAGAP